MKCLGIACKAIKKVQYAILYMLLLIPEEMIEPNTKMSRLKAILAQCAPDLAKVDARRSIQLLLHREASRLYSNGVLDWAAEFWELSLGLFREDNELDRKNKIVVDYKIIQCLLKARNFQQAEERLSNACAYDPSLLVLKYDLLLKTGRNQEAQAAIDCVEMCDMSQDQLIMALQASASTPSSELVLLLATKAKNYIRDFEELRSDELIVLGLTSILECPLTSRLLNLAVFFIQETKAAISSQDWHNSLDNILMVGT